MKQGIPIRLVSELSGVAPTTLRAWERRYQLLKPQRTPKGHRLYSQLDVQRVLTVVKLLQSGMSISEACQKVDQSLDRETNKEQEQWPALQRRMLKAIEMFDERKLDSSYQEALNLYPFGVVTEKLILPTLSLLGERWQERSCGIAEEHFFSAYLRNKLGARLQHESQRRNGSLLVIACLPGELHEIALLLFAIELLNHGYRTLYLGSNMPLEQIPHVASKAAADGVVLSGTLSSIDEITQSWQSLQALERPLMVGGMFSEQHHQWLSDHDGIALGSDMQSAAAKLRTIIPPYWSKKS